VTDQQQDVHIEPEALADGFRATDAGNALRLVAVADGRLRYVHQWGKFIIYREGVWHVDVKDVLAREVAKLVPRGMFTFAVRPELDTSQRDQMLRWAKSSESKTALAAMVELVRGVPGVLIEHTELDRRPELLNALNGTIDLRTGDLLEHDPEHLLTKQIPVIYDPEAKCPLFMEKLTEWQPDQAMRAYLQEKIGAGATGYPVEEFDIHLGLGGNGKGKFFGAVMHVLGPYAIVPHKSLIVQQRHEQHETVMADFFGARLAVAAETNRDAKLDEEKIKNLTGDDRLEARRMREDRWKWEPTHSLMLHTNHRPYVRGTDDGIWRRINLIPWEQTFIKNPDRELAVKLEREVSGILNWVVTGARRWLENERKFTRPEKVVVSTNDFRAVADPFYRFLNAVTMNGAASFVTTETLYEAFLAWRSDTGHVDMPKLVTKDALSRYLGRRYAKVKRWDGQHQVRGWAGLALNPVWAAEIERIRREEPGRLVRDLGDLAETVK